MFIRNGNKLTNINEITYISKLDEKDSNEFYIIIHQIDERNNDAILFDAIEKRDYTFEKIARAICFDIDFSMRSKR